MSRSTISTSPPYLLYVVFKTLRHAVVYYWPVGPYDNLNWISYWTFTDEIGEEFLCYYKNMRRAIVLLTKVNYTMNTRNRYWVLVTVEVYLSYALMDCFRTTMWYKKYFRIEFIGTCSAQIANWVASTLYFMLRALFYTWHLINLVTLPL